MDEPYKNSSERFLKLSNIFNISVTNSFADILASKLLYEYKNDTIKLSDVLLLLPNRRACQTMADAFIRQQGMSPTLLPQMCPLGDIDEDELTISEYGTDTSFLETAPSISPLERTLLFMKIIGLTAIAL